MIRTTKFARFGVSLIAVLALIALAAQISPVWSDDYNPPPWRGQPGSTYQQWVFLTPGAGPPDGPWNNPYGIPFHGSNGQWMPAGPNGRTGVWYLTPAGGVQTFEVPNQPILNPQKLIRVQVTWFDAPGTGGLLVGTNFTPFTGPTSFQPTPDGWWNGTWDIVLPFNPPFEQVVIMGADTWVDQVVIDTWCVPEPGSLMALGAGLIGLVPMIRRKR